VCVYVCISVWLCLCARGKSEKEKKSEMYLRSYQEALLEYDAAATCPDKALRTPPHT